jgi:hypothetical protein
MSKCQMNKYRAGGRCGGSAQPGRGGGEASSASVVSGALANLMAAREQQDRVFAPATATATATAPALVDNQLQTLAIIKKSVIDKKSCIDIILGDDF